MEYSLAVNHKALGTHIIVNMYGVNPEKISYVRTVKEIFDNVVKAADLTVLGESYKQFEPYGVTGILLLSESHLSIHTWPEKETALMDIFTCSIDGGGNHKERAEKALEKLVLEFKPDEYIYRVIKR
jgi:S-adenosylmethionine decarboxylase